MVLMDVMANLGTSDALDNFKNDPTSYAVQGSTAQVKDGKDASR
jgi:hypothetical protein